MLKRRKLRGLEKTHELVCLFNATEIEQGAMTDQVSTKKNAAITTFRKTTLMWVAATIKRLVGGCFSLEVAWALLAGKPSSKQFTRAETFCCLGRPHIPC